MVEGAAFVGGDVVGLVALDLILRLILARAMRMALVVKVARVDGDDRPRHSASFRIPADMIADRKSSRHLLNLRFQWEQISMMQCFCQGLVPNEQLKSVERSLSAFRMNIRIQLPGSQSRG